MRRFSVLIAIILCFPLSSYAQGIKNKEDNRAFIRPWLIGGFRYSDILKESSPAPVFRGGIFVMRRDGQYGADINFGLTPESLKYNFRTIVRLKKGLFSDLGADYVYRKNGILPTHASYIKGGVAGIKERKKDRIELAGGIGVEFLSYNSDGRYVWLSYKHSVMLYSLFRFDRDLAGSDKWMLRFENESILVRDAYDTRRRLGFSSNISVGFVYKGYHKGDSKKDH